MVHDVAVTFLRHLGRLVHDTFAYAFVTRRIGIVVMILVGLLLVSVGLTVQAATPYVIYPFV